MSQILHLFRGSVVLPSPLLTPVPLPERTVCPTNSPDRLLLTAIFSPQGTPDPGCAITAYVQTQLGEGQFFDIAAFTFAATGETRSFNLSAGAPITTATQLTQNALAAGTSVNGVLGRQYRCIVLVTGGYPAGSELEISGQFA